MKNKFAFTFLIVVIIFAFVGCNGNIENNDNKDSISSNVTQNLNIDYSAYEGLLGEVSNGVSEYCTYFVYDLNKDGINEIILKVGTYEADYTYHFYSLVDGHTVELGDFSAAHSVLYANEDGAGVIQVSGYQGYQTVTLITIADVSIAKNTLTTTIIKDGSIGDGDYYSNASPLSECYTKDNSLLEKDAKLIGQELVFDPNFLEPDGEETVFEQLPIDMDIIDMEISLLQKKVNDTIMQVHTDNVRNMGVSLKENQFLYCIFGDIYEYVIVENGLIVGYLSYNGHTTRDMTMKRYFPSDDCYSIAPLIAYGQDSYAYCCWKTADAYIILGAITQNGGAENYYNWATTKHIILKDFSQFDFSSQIVE